MDTDALIEALARDTAPVSPRAVERRLAAGILMGSLLALLLLVAVIGVRPELMGATGESIFWTKAAYTVSLGLVGFILTAQLARPDSQRLRWTWLIAAPPGVVLLLALAEPERLAPTQRAGLIFDPAWVGLPLVLALSAPIFAGLVWAFRGGLAPTRLRAAGAAAGLTAGGFGATLYCLYCEQVSLTYILTRYSVAIALASAAGALLGPRLMRW